MKNCPKCNRSYPDETLNFCLDCGVGLVVQSNFNQSIPTVAINQPRETQNAGFQNPPPRFAAGNNKAKKKSRAWLWMLGIFGVLIVLGGIGLIGVIALVASLPETNSNTKKPIISPRETPTVKKTPAITSSEIQKDDFSSWTYDNASIGKSVFADDELSMSSIDNNHYFMLTTPDDDFRTENSSTKVKVRNPSNQSTVLGYGLLIHCDDTAPGKKDYAFLIDSKTGSYRISKHKNTDETPILAWTKSTAIYSGSGYNELEVRDSNGEMTFLINGQVVKTITQSDGNKSGIVGIYTGSGFPVNFSNLEIKK